MKKKILIVIAMLIALFSTPMGMVHVNAEDENRIVYISKNAKSIIFVGTGINIKQDIKCICQFSFIIYSRAYRLINRA